MSLLVFTFLFIQFIAPNHGYRDIIDTNEPNEYLYQALTCSGNGDCKIICDESNSCYGATVTCPQHFLCDITCSGAHSCELANISCPYGASCAVNCNNQYSCQSTTIYAQYSSHFILNDCSSGDLSCNGMRIYFPPNNDGPRAVINGGDHLTSFNEKSLHFYAIFGWNDIQIINYQGLFEHNSNAFMHCLPDYSQTCPLASDSWSCAQQEHDCNAPPTPHPTASPTSSPSFQPTESTNEPTTNPTTNPTTSPSSNPTVTPTTLPTAQPSQHTNATKTTIGSTLLKLTSFPPPIEATVKITRSLTDITNNTNVTYMFEDEFPSFDAKPEPVGILWILITLLLSLLCFILIVLSYFFLPSRNKEMGEEHRGNSNDINKLILSALAENKNNKYDSPYPQDEEEISRSYMREGYDEEDGDNKLALLHKSSLRVHNNPLWINKEDTNKMEAPVTPSYKAHHIYPNGNLSKLHAQSCSHETGYQSNHNYAMQNGSNLTGFPYFNYLRPRSEPLSCALSHHLHEQQLSESLFNLQQQRLQRNSNPALMVIDDLKSSKPYQNLRVNAKLHEIPRKRSTFSVELAANKLLSPLSTVTSSSIQVSDHSVSDEEDPLHIISAGSFVGFPTTQTPKTNASSSDDSSPNVCSSSSSSSVSTSSSTTSSEEYQYDEDGIELELKEETTDSGHSDQWNIADSGDEDVEDESSEKHTHERNATMVVKDDPIANDFDMRAPTRVSITIHDSGLFESPFNDDNDKTVWTQTDNAKLHGDSVPHPVRVYKGEDVVDGLRSPTLEIQGLISV